MDTLVILLSHMTFRGNLTTLGAIHMWHKFTYGVIHKWHNYVMKKYIFYQFSKPKAFYQLHIFDTLVILLSQMTFRGYLTTWGAIHMWHKFLNGFIYKWHNCVLKIILFINSENLSSRLKFLKLVYFVWREYSDILKTF